MLLLVPALSINSPAVPAVDSPDWRRTRPVSPELLPVRMSMLPVDSVVDAVSTLILPDMPSFY